MLSKKLIAGCCFFDSFYYKGNLYKVDQLQTTFTHLLTSFFFSLQIGDTIKIDAEGQEIWIGEINSIYYDEKGTERSDDENSSKDNSEDEESDDNSVDDDCKKERKKEKRTYSSPYIYLLFLCFV